MGADYVEPDLVVTGDGVLVARHENEISGTTDIASHSEFAPRRTTRVIDGVTVTGWFTEDFSLAELKTLRARERLPQLRPANAAYDAQFEIPTLQDVIDLVRADEQRLNRPIGIYPETKHPSYFAGLGLPLEQRLVDVLHDNGYRDGTSTVFIQSFEVGNLQRLRQMTDLPLIQLMDAGSAPYDFAAAGDRRTYVDLAAPAGLTEVARYADGVGVHKDLIVPSATPASPTALVHHAHAAGLLVHAWTFRAENYFLLEPYRRGDPADPAYLRLHGDLAGELALFLQTGLDGFFTDFPDIGVARVSQKK